MNTTEKMKKDKKTRPPIVTLMGHVDHGKTSILDAIKETNLVSKESGGITQHTSAYSVEKDGNRIIFIDTPGHEAFSMMRARGGEIADIVILVVSADDGVMPQTKEAIEHIKKAQVPVIVAINKIDIEGVKIDKVKQQLGKEGILLEGYGGDVVSVEVSATKKIGIDKLMEVILLIAEMNEDKLLISKEDQLEALVIESKQTKNRGIEVLAIVKNGTLKVRDEVVIYNDTNNIGVSRIRALIREDQKQVKIANTGDIINILGFNKIPLAGDVILSKDSKLDLSKSNQPEPELDVSDTSIDKDGKSINVIIKADTAGTLEAIVSSLKTLTYEDVNVNILLAGIGNVKESDILLASSGKGIVLAFKVLVSHELKQLAQEKKVIIREYEIIYKLLEEIQGALEGVIEIEEQKIKGRGIIIKIFKLPKSEMKVAGTLVEAGRFKVNKRVGIYRDSSNKPLYIAKIKSIQEGAKKVEESQKGSECGLLFKPNIEDIQLDDRIEIL